MDVVATINTVLDEERKRRALNSDAALAVMLGVAPKTVSQWRNGRQISKSTRILLGLLAVAQAPAKEARS